MKLLIEKVFSNQIMKFVIVGGCSTAIDFFVYIILSSKINISLAKGISMVLSSIFSYFVNKSFTFENREKTSINYLVRFYIVFVMNLTVNLGINYIVHAISQNKMVAFMCATLCGMSVNYLGQKFLVFKK